MIWLLTSIGHGGLELLPHWVKHYCALGVDRIVFCVATLQGHTLNEVRAIAETTAPLTGGPKMFYGDIDFGYCLNIHQHDIQKSMAMNFGMSGNDWVMIADLDEFYAMPEGELPAETVARLAMANQHCLYGMMIDMVASDGSLAEVRRDVPIRDQFPIHTDLTAKLLGGGTNKVALHRAYCEVSEGHHDCRMPGAGLFQPLPPFAICRHYKWKSDLVPRLRTALENPATTSERWKLEASTMLNHLELHGGKINLAEVISASELKANLPELCFAQ